MEKGGACGGGRAAAAMLLLLKALLIARIVFELRVTAGVVRVGRVRQARRKMVAGFSRLRKVLARAPPAARRKKVHAPRRTDGSKAKSAGEEKNMASTIMSTTSIEATKAQPIHSWFGAAKAHRTRKASTNQ